MRIKGKKAKKRIAARRAAYRKALSELKNSKSAAGFKEPGQAKHW